MYFKGPPSSVVCLHYREMTVSSLDHPVACVISLTSDLVSFLNHGSSV